MATQNGHSRQSAGQTGRRANSRRKASRQKRKLVIFAVELVIIAVMLLVAYQIFRMTKPNQGPKQVILETDKLEIPEQVQQSEVMKGYMNIALFGVDAQKESQLYKGSRSDSIMVASINLDTGDIKLVSVYRDTFLNVGDNYFIKCNHAYSYGGAEQAVRTLNTNLDLDITNFITVGYKGLSEVIDGLGGVYLDVDDVELLHINNYQWDIAQTLKCDYTPVEHTGYQLLDGIQASAYCRIRYGGGGDFKRAERQRELIKAIEEQAKKSSLDTLTKTFNNAIDDIYTSLDSKDILDLLGKITEYRIVEEAGFPQEENLVIAGVGAKGSSVVPINLEKNVVWLHEFLFDEKDYVVSPQILEFDEMILSETKDYIHGLQ